MTTPIYFFLKFCEEKKYADSFAAGRLWMNPLSYFKALDGTDDDGRADRHEAPSAWHQPSTLGSIQIGSIQIAPSELAGPVIVQDIAADYLNVLCLYAATPPFSKVTNENLDALQAHLEIPSVCRKMGRFAVVIRSSRAFIKRVDDAAKAQHLALERGLVTYFDANSFSGTVGHPAFAKKDDYKWQREYRIAIDRRMTSPEPFIFDIGSLHDVCTVVESDKLGPITVSPPRA